jgi:hypothetical protein
MKFLLVLLILAVSTGQTHAQELTKGKLRVREAMTYQGKIKSGKISLVDVRDEWHRATKDPDVKKDKDALAIAYASMALAVRDLGELESADSLLHIAMPNFQLKASKAFFLLSQANLKHDLKKSGESLELFTEIATDFDSLPQLKGITFYANSGYAELAYGIDAARNIALIGLTDQRYKSQAIKTLSQVSKKHRADEMGLMALVGLKKLDKSNAEKYDTQMEALFSKKAELRELAAEFSKQL